jgi:hypothetical protein
VTRRRQRIRRQFAKRRDPVQAWDQWAAQSGLVEPVRNAKSEPNDVDRDAELAQWRATWSVR